MEQGILKIRPIGSLPLLDLWSIETLHFIKVGPFRREDFGDGRLANLVVVLAIEPILQVLLGGFAREVRAEIVP